MESLERLKQRDIGYKVPPDAVKLASIDAKTPSAVTLPKTEFLDMTMKVLTDHPLTGPLATTYHEFLKTPKAHAFNDAMFELGSKRQAERESLPDTIDYEKAMEFVRVRWSSIIPVERVARKSGEPLLRIALDHMLTGFDLTEEAIANKFGKPSVSRHERIVHNIDVLSQTVKEDLSNEEIVHLGIALRGLAEAFEFPQSTDAGPQKILEGAAILKEHYVNAPAGPARDAEYAKLKRLDLALRGIVVLYCNI